MSRGYFRGRLFDLLRHCGLKGPPKSALPSRGEPYRRCHRQKHGNKPENRSKDLEKLHLHALSPKSDLAEAGYRDVVTFYEIPCGLTQQDVGAKGLV